MNQTPTKTTEPIPDWLEHWLNVMGVREPNKHTTVYIKSNIPAFKAWKPQEDDDEPPF